MRANLNFKTKSRIAIANKMASIKFITSLAQSRLQVSLCVCPR